MTEKPRDLDPTDEKNWTPEMHREFEIQSSGLTNDGAAREKALIKGGYRVTPDLASRGDLTPSQPPLAVTDSKRPVRGATDQRAADAQPKPEDQFAGDPGDTNRPTLEGAEIARKMVDHIDQQRAQSKSD